MKMRIPLIVVAMLIFVSALPAQQVNWTWTPPNGNDPIASYTLYQSVGCGSTYTIVASGVTTPAYDQTPVPIGTTCIYVTAVDVSGFESAPSNTFRYSFAGLPNPPTNLTATLATAVTTGAVKMHKLSKK
jgi:hypothetical protein